MVKRVIVAGSRAYDNYPLMQYCLDYLLARMADADELEIVSGHAAGADQLGEKYASVHAINLKIFPADWDKHGHKAGPIRNTQMIKYAIEESPMLVAFWDGKSHGTMDILAKVQTENIPCYVVIVDEKGNLISTVEYSYGVIPIENRFSSDETRCESKSDSTD